MNINDLKKVIEVAENLKIDFRSDKHLKNSSNLYPIMDYKKAKKIVARAIRILDLNNKNINMELDKIRVNYTLKELLECYINEALEKVL